MYSASACTESAAAVNFDGPQVGVLSMRFETHCSSGSARDLGSPRGGWVIPLMRARHPLHPSSEQNRPDAYEQVDDALLHGGEREDAHAPSVG